MNVIFWRSRKTFIAALLIVMCLPISYHHSVRSMGSDAATMEFENKMTAERFRINHDGSNIECGNNVNEESGMNTAFPPAGAGQFRDPMDVLGPKFLPSITINLCEVQLHEHADQVSDIKFTAIGNKTCSDVCVQYRLNMRLDGPVTVALVETFCDYTGASDFDGGNDSDLSTTCTCMYKMRCNSRSKVVIYIFEANCKGFLKVSVTDVIKKNCITR